VSTKIAVPAIAPDLDAQVDRRFGTCAFLLVVDAETMAFEALPGASRGSGRGMAMVVSALRKDVDVILARYLSPRLATTLRENGIQVTTGATGTVRDVINDYLSSRESEVPVGTSHIVPALARSLRQLSGMLPTLAAVVLLIGLFKTFVSKEMLASVFSGNPVTDTFWGACFGSVLAGNAVNSYVIGKGLLDTGVGLAGVIAFIFTWVSVGLVQLPVEIEALGARFAIVRTVVAFVFSIPVALSTACLVGLVT